jgi:hypothetical protein
LVEPFHFAAGLWMVGPGVVALDAEHTELDLEGDPALAALFGGENRTIVGEHPGRDFPCSKGFAEAGHHVQPGGVRAGVAGPTQPGVVVENVQD